MDIKETLKKLQILAERGIDGEAESAKVMLDRLLLKHKITLKELEVDDLQIHVLTIPNRRVKLFSQIACNVNHTISCGVIPKRFIKRHGGNVVIQCTRLEYLLITQMFDHYNTLYSKELEVFYTAFIHANHLYSSAPPVDIKELSDEEKEERSRATKMASQISKETFNKRIT